MLQCKKTHKYLDDGNALPKIDNILAWMSYKMGQCNFRDDKE